MFREIVRCFGDERHPVPNHTVDQFLVDELTVGDTYYLTVIVEIPFQELHGIHEHGVVVNVTIERLHVHQKAVTVHYRLEVVLQPLGMTILRMAQLRCRSTVGNLPIFMGYSSLYGDVRRIDVIDAATHIHERFGPGCQRVHQDLQIGIEHRPHPVG